MEKEPDWCNSGRLKLNKIDSVPNAGTHGSQELIGIVHWKGIANGFAKQALFTTASSELRGPVRPSHILWKHFPDRVVPLSWLVRAFPTTRASCRCGHAQPINEFNELCKLCTCRVVITEKSKTWIQREKVDIGIHWMDSISWPQSVADSSWAYVHPQIGPAFELIPFHPWWLSQASILGAVAGAHLVRHVAPAYGVPAGEPRFSPLIGSCKQLEMWYFGFVHWCSLLFRHWQR